MLRKYLGLFLVASITNLSSQTSISGYIDLKKNHPLEQKVFLSKLDMDHLENLKYGKSVAWARINDDGYFSFDGKYIADKSAVYHLYVREVEKVLKDTISRGSSFILSNSDDIKFSPTKSPFTEYTTTNLADKEWKKLREFETQLLHLQPGKEQESLRLKSFAKDSLQILLVKLISIKQLENKQLLDQDIAKNPEYYLALLEELKGSEMPKEQYRFLERKLAFLTQEAVEQKYNWSMALNFILGFLIVALAAILVFRRKEQPIFPELSKQERTIQDLILQGKTNKEIANELFISISTVKTHITNIYGKLKVSNRQELFQKAQN